MASRNFHRPCRAVTCGNGFLALWPRTLFLLCRLCCRYANPWKRHMWHNGQPHYRTKIAIDLSHYRLLERLAASNSSAVILEDDAQLTGETWLQDLLTALQELPHVRSYGCANLQTYQRMECQQGDPILGSGVNRKAWKLAKLAQLYHRTAPNAKFCRCHARLQLVPCGFLSAGVQLSGCDSNACHAMLTLPCRTGTFCTSMLRAHSGAELSVNTL